MLCSVLTRPTTRCDWRRLQEGGQAQKADLTTNERPEATHHLGGYHHTSDTMSSWTPIDGPSVDGRPVDGQPIDGSLANGSPASPTTLVVCSAPSQRPAEPDELVRSPPRPPSPIDEATLELFRNIERKVAFSTLNLPPDYVPPYESRPRSKPVLTTPLSPDMIDSDLALMKRFVQYEKKHGVGAEFDRSHRGGCEILEAALVEPEGTRYVIIPYDDEEGLSYNSITPDDSSAATLSCNEDQGHSITQDDATAPAILITPSSTAAPGHQPSRVTKSRVTKSRKIKLHGGVRRGISIMAPIQAPPLVIQSLEPSQSHSRDTRIEGICGGFERKACLYNNSP